MRTPFLFMFILIASAACTQKDRRERLEGSWKVDSVYSYYNGFGYTHYDVDKEPLYHYQPDGKVRLTLGQDFRYLLYDLSPADTLSLRGADGKIFSVYHVEGLTRDLLQLRLKKEPLFRGGTQERYEVRYLSRVKDKGKGKD